VKVLAREAVEGKLDPRVRRTRELLVRAFNELRRRLPPSPGLNVENFKALAACEYLAGLNTACSWKDRQFRPLIEARVQNELYAVLPGWIEALPQRTDGKPATPEVAASAVSWAIFGAGLQWSRNGAGPAADEVADQVLKVIFEGLDGGAARLHRLTIQAP
jgi:AcrR family transcriptional regulator